MILIGVEMALARVEGNLKIVMVSETFYPLIGGIPDHIFHLSEELKKRGHSVKILTARFKLRKDQSDDGDLVRIGYGVPIRANKSFARLTLGWRPSNKVKRFFLDFVPDIIHLHGSLAPMLPILALRHSKVINVATFHAGHQKSTGYIIFRPLLMPYFRKLHGLIAVSKTAESAMAKYFPGPYRIIPNGIDVEGFNPRARPEPRFADDRKKILFMNRLEPKKGLPHLIRALRHIKREFPDILLIVAGSGPFADYYKGMVDDEISKNIVFVGKIPANPVSLRASYYAACDVFCAPSIGHESFGIVLLEGMACGKPVVASRIAGFVHVLEDGQEGFFFPPKDDLALARAVITILKNKDLIQRMGQAGRRKALKYSWAHVAEMVEDYYYELTERYCIRSAGS
ncbi:MAG TPA: glycosyltransferase family 1 protein [bacterium (Candidatus Stahlbacteria)]|nr:glycosyltransferase family 1 protein [Candidatus Stahlbacteria bacterium]